VTGKADAMSQLPLLTLLLAASGGALLARCNSQGVPLSGSSSVELAGRTAGPAARCVPVERSEALRLSGDRTILYGRGRTIWVNRVGTDCNGIRRSDILIVEPIGAQYCRGDRLRSLDPVSRVPGPGCLLGDFVPYRR
jgi:hypothetical protein